jgi:potassium-dependent mechanosensitive channel
MSYLIKVILLFYCFTLALPAAAFSGPAESMILGDDISSLISIPNEQQNSDVPDPTSLKLNWWDYFDVKTPQEFSQRINASSQHLHSLLSRLSGQDLETATSYINNIVMQYNSLFSFKQQQPLETPNPQPFLQSYTIEQQIELNHKIKLALAEKKNEEEDLDNLQERIQRMQKHLDNLLVPYLAQTKPSAEKTLAGLEIMANKSALVSAQEQLKQNLKRVEVQKTRLSFLQKELEASKEVLNFKQFDARKIEADIKAAEAELDRRQSELLKLENSAFVTTTQNPQERNQRYLFNQKLIHAATVRSLAWTRLAFHNLKYNLYMHLNKRFNESNKEMHDKLRDWTEHLDKIASHAKEWKKAALREQDRVRQDYASLISKQEANDSKTIKLNQSRRQESLDTLSTLQMLEDELGNSRWLINQLDTYIRVNSSFVEVSWMNVTAAFDKTKEVIEGALNYTLFKIGELPITLLSLSRIALIITISLLLSKILRSTLMTFGKRRGNVTASTLYTLGRLVHYVALIVGFLLALVSIGFDFSNLVLVASALTLGIGFGLQSFANNFICGLCILFERNLKIGDYIELQSGTYGKVTEIHVQNTVICTSDGVEIVIPNSDLTNHTLINYTMNNDFRRLNILFSVASDADKNLVREVVSQAATHVPCIAPISQYGEPQVWLKKFDKYSLEFCLAVWVNYKKKSHSDSKEADFLWEIETALRKHNIPLTSSSPTILLSHNNQLTELPMPEPGPGLPALDPGKGPKALCTPNH